MSGATFTEALWRQRLIVLVTAALFLVAAAFASVILPKTYQASATLYLDTVLGAASQQDFIVLATKRPVLSEACTFPGVGCSAKEIDHPETELSKRVAVAIVQGSSLLSITATAPTADGAAALANAVAQAMIDQDHAEVLRTFKPSEDALNTEATRLATAMNNEQNGVAAGGSAAAAHQAQLTELATQYVAVQNRLQDLTVQKEKLLGVATVIEQATAPSEPVIPDPLRYLLAALVAGLLVGVLAALLRQRFDDRLFSTEGLAKATGASFVTVIPAHSPRGLIGGSTYALAHANLLARYPHTHRVLVAAASMKDRADGVAAGLGVVAAETGQRVLLARSDPTMGLVLPTAANANGSALTTVTLPSENVAQAASALINAGDYDFAVLAVPSVDSSPAALTLARSVDQTILVATVGVTHFAEARRAADLLRQAGGTVAASFLVPRRKQRRDRGN
jgi:succinoglycan biosynthesis transport protein ExoP